MPRSTGRYAANREQQQFLRERNKDAEKDILESDYFRMFVFKIEECTRKEPHDWTLCHFAHESEKARRRNPRDFINHHNSCTEFRKHGFCKAGDRCTFAHGVFEGWLTPARYRTKMCSNWREGCKRQICFFAHSHEQLRTATPENMPAMQVLHEEMIWSFMHDPVHAFNLGQICNPVQLQDPSEIVGRNLAAMQWLLNYAGQQALPELLLMSSHDLVDLKLTLQMSEAGDLQHDPSTSEAIGSVHGAQAFRDHGSFMTQPNHPPASPYPNLQSMQVEYEDPERILSGLPNFTVISRGWPGEGLGLQATTQQAIVQEQGIQNPGQLQGQDPDIDVPTSKAYKTLFKSAHLSTGRQYRSKGKSIQDDSIQDLADELWKRLSLGGHNEPQGSTPQEHQHWGQIFSDASATSGQFVDQDYVLQQNSQSFPETLSGRLSLLSQRDSHSSWNELQDLGPFKMPQADRESSQVMRPPNHQQPHY